MDSNGHLRILIVDDMPEMIHIISDILKDDYEIIATTHGDKALELAASQSFSAIILDIMMPDIDGFEVCRRLKQADSTQEVPVIFITSLDSSLDVERGLTLGAYYYLTKPVDPQQLKAIVRTACDEYSLLHSLQTEYAQILECLGCLNQGDFGFRTLKQAQSLALLIAKSCPSPDLRVQGLIELMVNAIEHGNLGISYEEKSQLNREGRWKQEVESRQQAVKYQDRQATLSFQRNHHNIEIVITDQGNGFDWEPYLDISVERATHSHGRGIAMARMLSFDSLEYIGNGNQVKVTINL